MKAPKTMLEFRQEYIGFLIGHRKVVVADFAERVHALFEDIDWDQNEDLIRDLKTYIRAMQFELDRIDKAILDVLTAPGIDQMKCVVRAYHAAIGQD
jgi:hypothetical protein